MTRKILLTGVTGFIGRQVARVLSKSDVELRLVIRKGKEKIVEPLECPIDIVETQDLFQERSEWWEEQCHGIDTVIHSAWYAEPGQYLHSSKNLDCLSGSIEIAKGAAKAGISRFVGIGSCVEYDLRLGDITIETPLRPITPYAGAKAALYTSLSHWFPIYSIEFAWCRLFCLYGEGEDPRRLVAYLRAKLGEGEIAELSMGTQVRDYLNVAEAGRMISEIALGSEIGPINICSGKPITIREIAERIADEYGRRDLLLFGVRAQNADDPPRIVCKA